MGHTARTEPQCLYKGALYLFFKSFLELDNISEPGSALLLRWKGRGWEITVFGLAERAIVRVQLDGQQI